jgi:phage tail-like protein
LPPIPPGLDRYSRRYLEYLPPIYHTDFMSRFLALFEAILMPVEWTVDGFDMFLDPETAPAGFLPWLQNWFLIAFDDTWSDEKRRTFLLEAHKIYARRGTKWALARMLEIYLGQKPDIDDDSQQLEPLTFLVRIPLPESSVDRELVENLIDLSACVSPVSQMR